MLNASPTLYYSVMSLSALYMSKLEADVSAKNMALTLYQTTLTHLQAALYDPAVAFEDSTLMATIIIGLYELIDKSGHESWCSHSRGTAELMKLRGADISKTGIAKMLFLTFRGYEVMRAILQKEETFVADDAWTINTSSKETIAASQGILANARSPLDPSDISIPGPPDYGAVLFMLGGKVANLRAKCLKLARAQQLSTETKEELLQVAKDLESKLHTWRSSLPAAYDGREEPGTLRASPYRLVRVFDHFSMGYQLCFYASFLLLLHRSVAKYIYDDIDRVPDTDQEYARFIIKTSEQLTRGLTTVSLTVTWPIFMAAISLRNSRERIWASKLLKIIGHEKGWAIARAALHAAHVMQTHDGRNEILDAPDLLSWTTDEQTVP